MTETPPADRPIELPTDPGRRGVLRGTATLGLSALAASVATACVGGGPPAGAQDPGDLTAADMIGKTLRVYHTGDALTMDYSDSRLNVELGPDDRIVRVYVG